jgi:capsular exopolysaccharide synthesis family protein
MKAATLIKKPESQGGTRAITGSSLSAKAMEEYDHLKQSILDAMPENEAKLLLFAGCGEGEGNSSIVANFGIFLASAGESPLLVDVNFRDPVLHEVFSVGRSPGMAELLSGRHSLGEAIKATCLPNLSLVPAGDLPENPFGLLSDSRIDSIFEQMRRESKWVLVDAPAVNVSNDAVALASKADGVVLVLRAEKTRWEVARSVRQRLENGKANIIGAVLNDRKLHIPGWIYGRL